LVGVGEYGFDLKPFGPAALAGAACVRVYGISRSAQPRMGRVRQLWHIGQLLLDWRFGTYSFRLCWFVAMRQAVVSEVRICLVDRESTHALPTSQNCLEFVLRTKFNLCAAEPTLVTGHPTQFVIDPTVSAVPRLRWLELWYEDRRSGLFLCG
jgi:hypothetical protein